MGGTSDKIRGDVGRRRGANPKGAKSLGGPRTPAGKARSSRNATRHGLLSGAVVVDWSDFEDPKEFERLRANLRQDLAPEGTLEELLVEKIAVGFWRLQRMWAFERHRIRERLEEKTSEIADAQYEKRSEVDYRRSCATVQISYEERSTRILKQVHEVLQQSVTPDRSLEEILRSARDVLREQAQNWASMRRSTETLSVFFGRTEGVQLDGQDDAESASRAGADRSPGGRPEGAPGAGSQVSPEMDGLSTVLDDLMASTAQACASGEIGEEDAEERRKALSLRVKRDLELREQILESLKVALTVLEEQRRWMDQDGRSEEKLTASLQPYVVPPPEELDVYLRYETSTDRRLQRDIETLFAVQALRRGGGTAVPPGKLRRRALPRPNAR